jgi:hypothetical protein
MSRSAVAHARALVARREAWPGHLRVDDTDGVLPIDIVAERKAA